MMALSDHNNHLDRVTMQTPSNNHATQRTQIGNLIFQGKTGAEIIKMLQITNGVLKFHLNHLASEYGLSNASIASIFRYYQRELRRVF